MPTIEGNLNTNNIQSILDLLAGKNPASTWLISDGREEKVIYFSTGGIRLYASDHRKISSLGHFLIQHRLVTKDQLQMAREASRVSRQESLDEALDRMGFLPRSRYQEAISRLIYLELCDVVTWENAIFEFYEGNPPPQIFDHKHPALHTTQDVRKLANRVRQWNQEWNQLKSKLYSERLRIKFLGDLDQMDLSSTHRRLYKSMDGKNTLRDIAILCSIDFPELARMVHRGLQEGYLRGAISSRKEASTPEEVLNEIEQLEEALDKAINAILIHKRIASGYEKIGENDRASEHYHMVGNLEAQSGRIVKAMENYRHALQLSPQNLSVHESLIRSLQDSGEDEKALVEIVAMAKKLFSFGFLERAYEHLRGVVSKVPHLLDVRLLFADILLALGRKAEAAKEYAAIARDKKRTLSPEEIEDLYQKVLSLDPMNKEARSGLVVERKRRAGKALVFINRITGVAAVFLLLAWLSNEVVARCAWAKAENQIRQSINTGNSSQGFSKLWSFGKKYPSSLLHTSLLDMERELFKMAFYRMEAKLEEAERLRKQGWFAESNTYYREVSVSDLVPSQRERARQGLELLKEDRKVYNELSENAEFYLKIGSYEHAYYYAKKVNEKFPGAGQNLRVPFFIRTDPAGAKVKVNGTFWGYAPIWIVVPLRGPQEIVVEKQGYRPKAVRNLLNGNSPFITIPLN